MNRFADGVALRKKAPGRSDHSELRLVWLKIALISGRKSACSKGSVFLEDPPKWWCSFWLLGKTNPNWGTPRKKVTQKRRLCKLTGLQPQDLTPLVFQRTCAGCDSIARAECISHVCLEQSFIEFLLPLSCGLALLAPSQRFLSF